MRLLFRIFLAVSLSCALLVSADTSDAKTIAGLKVHKVYSGQRLGSIAKRYNVSIDALCTANDIDRKDPLKVGQELVIPKRSDKTGEEAAAAVAKAEGKKPPRSKKANKKKAERKSRKKSSKASGYRKLHKVYRGQRLGSIAKRYQISVEALCTANGIDPTDPIKPGQELVIPNKGDTTGEAAAAAAAKLSDSDDPPRKSAEKKERAKTSRRSAKGKSAPPSKPRSRRARRNRPLKVHTIAKGQRLSSIARRYQVELQAILYANDLGKKDIIRPGQKLVIPATHDESGEIARRLRERGKIRGLANSKRKKSRSRSSNSWLPYKRPAKKRGYVTFVGFNDRWKGYVIDPKGRVIPNARIKISRVLNAEKLKGGIHPRLIQLLSKVSDTFGGRPIRVVSGHRTRSYSRASRHKLGHAIDFSIPGVPNAVLRDYLIATFEKVGVGYYPNSSFVHFDVRERKTIWVDYSGPGEPPRYKQRPKVVD